MTYGDMLVGMRCVSKKKKILAAKASEIEYQRAAVLVIPLFSREREKD